jgi:hypothetical protein
MWRIIEGRPFPRHNYIGKQRIFGRVNGSSNQAEG